MYLDHFVSDLPGRSRGYKQDQHRRFVSYLRLSNTQRLR